jgi:MFS family permease
MSFATLFRISPLGCVGMLLTGGMFSAMFGMAAVYGTTAGFSVAQITLFSGAAYVGGLVFQYPIGWVSDRIDRRQLVLWLSLGGAAAMALGAILTLPFAVLLGLSLVMGGVVNPLYSLLIAHTNDYLLPDDMASASSGLVFINGLGAVTGPVITGWLMEKVGSGGFFLYVATLMLLLAGYALWRTTRRAAPSPADSGAFVILTPVASALAVEAVVEERSMDEGPTPTP